MPFRFALDRPDYSDLASGRVLYSLPGHPAFPVRLASEIFQRCFALWKNGNPSELPMVYDPCCGAGYLLTVLAYLHGDLIRALAASDIDPKAVEFAQRNLSLLTIAGLDRRIGELAADHARYGKELHLLALESAHRMRKQIDRMSPLPSRVFQADAGNPADLQRGLSGSKVDLVITDIPYGRHSEWLGRLHDDPHPIRELLNSLLAVLSPTSLVAVASDKAQKISRESYRRIERFSIGKRQVVILIPEISIAHS